VLGRKMHRFDLSKEMAHDAGMLEGRTNDDAICLHA